MCLPLFFRGGALIYQAIETNRTSAEVANGGFPPRHAGTDLIVARQKEFIWRVHNEWNFHSL
ncbi:hypothetical protein [Geothrix fuzhouensis]|uniref:hypothetical protein n=1 Tax=Geothrix fuzhouensis TaxID=2966451 RepID=UPI0021496A35|nr:hypothetical protein [Geothrix fuzhouensis]